MSFNLQCHMALLLTIHTGKWSGSQCVSYIQCHMAVLLTIHTDKWSRVLYDITLENVMKAEYVKHKHKTHAGISVWCHRVHIAFSRQWQLLDGWQAMPQCNCSDTWWKWEEYILDKAPNQNCQNIPQAKQITRTEEPRGTYKDLAQGNQSWCLDSGKNVKIISRYGDNESHIKCELSSAEQQKQILRSKNNLGRSKDPMISRIYIRPSKSQEQRNHIKVWLQETGLQSKYLLLDSGKLVRKRQRGRGRSSFPGRVVSSRNKSNFTLLDTDEDSAPGTARGSPYRRAIPLQQHHSSTEGGYLCRGRVAWWHSQGFFPWPFLGQHGAGPWRLSHQECQDHFKRLRQWFQHQLQSQHWEFQAGAQGPVS